jgi:hypothetical protein
MKGFQATGEACSPQRKHPALQNMKICSFFLFGGSFLSSWILIWIPNLDPDPQTVLNTKHWSVTKTIKGLSVIFKVKK